MKNIKIIIFCLLIAFGLDSTATIAESRTVSSSSILINGVRWATCNVAASGFFAVKPEDAGMFYQWNSKVGWLSSGSVTGWNSLWNGGYTSPSATDIWIKANNPCPTGYRVPTFTEIKTLLDTAKVTCTWISQIGVFGRIFTDKATGNSIFLPASGGRHGDDGILGHVGNGGYYWSGTAGHANYAYYLAFGSSGAVWNYGGGRELGFNIRPVAE